MYSNGIQGQKDNMLGPWFLLLPFWHHHFYHDSYFVYACVMLRKVDLNHTVIQTLTRQKQKGCESKASLGYCPNFISVAIIKKKSSPKATLGRCHELHSFALDFPDIREWRNDTCKLRLEPEGSCHGIVMHQQPRSKACLSCPAKEGSRLASFHSGVSEAISRCTGSGGGKCAWYLVHILCTSTQSLTHRKPC